VSLDETVAALRLEPSPRGGGRTAHNWSVLARAGADDLDTARLAEAHLDAATVLYELGSPPPTERSRWGVWAAEGPGGASLTAERNADGRWVLSGRKPWCSGALGPCTHALVTARAGDERRLFAVEVGAPGVRVREGEWQGVGMRRSAAATVEMDAVAVQAVGGPDDYLERTGFWHGAIGVAAAWCGGAFGVAAPLYRAGRDERLDPHGLAHLGAVDAALVAARTLLERAAADVDPEPDEPIPVARRRALQARAVVETAVETAIRRTGRALGPAPLAVEGDHAQRVADLEVYVRQSHAERDLATLGALAAEADPEGAR
jgi:hypothetical protein